MISHSDESATVTEAVKPHKWTIMGAINSSDIRQKFKSPRHDAFAEPTRWRKLNAMTGTAKKYTPQRVDRSYRALNTAFCLDGRKPLFWRRSV